ncbi:autoinducer binding domain-containing protein [Pseudoduganella plicata]|uniref:LuxR family transcriptional regulator n=1 Tax=Pseudoduganella plicata TaxID=321984 RepID=A0A4P7BJS3_9BURK|nr:autoinducer binding domain-containing protein [Pseudoduganella plicata]QBQ38417.1 LuxR family transcriptional regulator [Pseudoduganella plicata]GGY81928.1 LuxR family transcriptional regulator [Pseudoduganella plicata]
MQVLEVVKSEAEVLEVLIAAVLELGFEYCAFGVRWPLPVIRPAVSMISNYPESWRQRYLERNYLACDPTVAHGLTSQTALVWSDQVFAAAPALWDDARDHGLRVGVAQSSYNARGVAGLLTVSRSHEQLGEAELREHAAHLWWLSQAALDAMSRVAPQSGRVEADICLTAREVEVLRWSADGKTASDIAEIIQITERTVGFHINNALLKLGTANKTAGVIKAALLRLL